MSSKPVSPHRVDLPHDFPLEQLPPVCVVTGRTGAVSHPVTLAVSGDTANRSLEAGLAVAMGAVSAAVTGGLAMWLTPSSPEVCRLSLPFSAEAAQRDTRERVVRGLTALTGLVVPLLLAIAIMMMTKGFLGVRRPISPSWFMLPALLSLGSAVAFVVTVLRSQPAVRCLKVGSRAVVLELPSAEAAKAMRAALRRLAVSR